MTDFGHVTGRWSQASLKCGSCTPNERVHDDEQELRAAVASKLDLWSCRAEVNLTFVVVNIQRYRFDRDRYHEARTRPERDVKLLRAARIRRSDAPCVELSPWRYDPEAGSPLVEARHWALFQLECVRVSRRLRARLLDLVE